MIYIKVTTQLSNNYPTNQKCPLSFSISSSSINVAPLMEVSPSSLRSAVIPNSYLKVAEGNELKDTNADISLKFEVVGYDKFKNVAKVDQGTLKVKIVNEIGVSINDFTSTLDVTTGHQIYTVNLINTGTYTISAGTNEDDESLFKSKYTVLNKYGAIDNSASIIQVKNIAVEAGDNASISITPRDKNNNPIPANEVAQSFTISLVSPLSKKETIVTSMAISEDNSIITFTTTPTEKGENEWRIKLSGSSLDCFGCYTNVSPTYCEPRNTLVYSKDESGKLKLHEELGSTMTSSVNNPLSISLTFRDQYNNIIDSVGSKITVSNAIMSGNNMDQISFTSSISSDNSKINIDLPSDEAIKYKFNHLVQRSNYSFNFDVIYNREARASFTYIVSHTTNKDDDGYGNGAYIVQNTQFSSNEVSFNCGTSTDLTMTLKTNENLIYNDDLNLTSDVVCTSPSDDPTFTCQISKAGTNYGVYNIKIYSELVSKSSSNRSFNLKIKGENTSFIKMIVKIGIPDPTKTEVRNTIQPEYDSGESIEIEFYLFDKFNNQYIDMESIISSNYLTVLNQNSKVASPIIILKEDLKTFKVSFKPIYPPREMDINILYSDSLYTVQVLPESIKTSIKSSVNWENTQISSKNIQEMIAGEKLELKVSLYDSEGVCLDNIEEEKAQITATVEGPLESVEGKVNIEYKLVKKIDTTTQTCQLSFELDIKDDDPIYTKTGTYAIKIIANKSKQLGLYNQKLVSAVADSSKFIVEFNYPSQQIPTYFVVGDSIYFKAIGRDKYGNTANTIIGNDFTIKLKDIKTGNYLEKDHYKEIVAESIQGTVEYDLSLTKSGLFEVEYYYKDDKISPDLSKGPANLDTIPGKCSIENPHVDLSLLENLQVNVQTSISMTCYDKYNNKVINGGDQFEVFVSLKQEETTVSITTKITDNNDGTYKADFTPPLAGDYHILVLLDEQKYGETEIVIKSSTCEGDTPFLCPNQNKCVDDMVKCIEPPNDCPRETPFLCKVNGVEGCQASQNDCDCPTGMIRCGYMNVCVFEEYEDMCPFTLPVNCKKYGANYKLCGDGICRLSEDYKPNQRVCPIGFILCPDLSCRSSYDECLTYENCEDNEIRCNDQTCVTDQKYCPSTITCSSPGMKVCSDGTCVENEIECSRLPKCPENNPILCNNNSCVADANSCPKSVSCGHGLSLCSDLICRENCNQ